MPQNKEEIQKQTQALFDYISTHPRDDDKINWMLFISESTGNQLIIRAYSVDDFDDYKWCAFDPWCYYEIGKVDVENERVTFTVENVPLCIIEEIANNHADIDVI